MTFGGSGERGIIDPMNPETQYTKSAGGYVGYQVFGDGPRELILVNDWMTNLDVMWEEPSLARYLARLGSFARVLCFDRRGSGVSDPVPLAALPTIEEWMDDAKVVMDAAGFTQAAVVGNGEGGPMAVMLAANHPSRVKALVLVNSFARWLRDDDYPIGMPPETTDVLVDQFEAHWGVDANMLMLTAPSVADDTRFRNWFTRYQRLAMPRGAATTMYAWVVQHIDVRAVLPSVRVPTLIIHRTDNPHYRVDFGRYLADHISGAELVEIPGADVFPLNAGDFSPILDHIQQFVTGVREVPEHNRVMATVMFADVVGSTELASSFGDQRWLDVQSSYHRMMREYVERFEGREIGTSGDGYLATFDGPARGVRCASGAVEEVRQLGIEIRAGLHTGEIELRSSDIGGIAVHIAARVMAAAPDSGVLVSATVKDLVAGSGIEFSALGAHHLKGVPGEWPLFQASKVINGP